MSDPSKPDDSKARLSRRAFIGSTAGAATVLGTGPARAQESPPPRNVAPGPSAAQLERELDATPPSLGEAGAVETPGSDLMAQVLKDLGIEYVTSNPGSSTEGLWESIINYGDTPNESPEYIVALHEEAAVDMAHGYAKAEGKPLVVMLHGTIGLMHASMAIYNAFHSQTPIVIIVGRDDTNFVRAQAANDIAGIARAHTKWDALPTTIDEATAAIQEAYRQAITPPMGPVMVVLDTELQKQEANGHSVPAYVPPRIKGISEDQAREIAAGLIAARNPRLDVGRFRTPEGAERAVELADLVGASVVTRAWIDPMSFPQGHPLCGPGFDQDYDFTLGLERGGAQASIRGPHRRTVEGRDPMGIGFGFIRKPPAPYWGPYREPKPGENDIIVDAETSIPLLIAEAWNQLSPEKRREIEQRKEKIAAANAEARVAKLRKGMDERRRGWTGSPIATARLFAELYSLIKDEDWCLSSPTQFTGQHNRVFWEHNKPHSHLGMHGAGALGYCIGASVGAGLAAKKRDRIVINIQPDGDLNYVPASLWTAAHHQLPMLTIMHNNRAYHQEYMYAQYVSAVRKRGVERAHIGMTFTDPYISYAKLAEAYGVESEGPIDDPELLLAALERGVATVKAGRPYLIDVLTQPR